ncbi:ABC transporter ATP-binding protein [Companilactobacillus sp. DQM5]|uniref:ABC transporter ATP-binding protein n=1 Tax=Companilactobacillus sp. DQM5 TaxID=3463359 RepID=UPI004057D471
MEVLNLKNISKIYKDGNENIEVLKDINLSVNSGEFVAIIGPSGSGKSTFLTMAGALLHPTSGSIVIDKEDITKVTDKQLTNIRLNKIGFIFQNAELIPYLSVVDQLNFISKIAHIKEYETNNFKILKSVGLEKHLKKFPNQLSGGQRQRVAIARSLVNNPTLLLADEPTASLDSKRGIEIVKMLQTISHQQNKAVVMVTHDERILEFVDKIYKIDDGNMTQEM